MLDPVFLAFMILIPMIMSTVSAARSKLAGSSPYYVLYVAAMMIFIVWGPLTKVFLNDLFFIPGVVSNLFLICCQSLMLSHGYAETKRREEALTEHNELLSSLNRTKTEFLQDMSHEMKAPLTIIATGIDYSDSIISEENGDISKAREALGKIRVETQRLGRMVSGMITLVSMNETGENRKRVDFAALLMNSAEAHRVALEQRSNSLRVEIASCIPDAFVENDKFTQVIANLFSNAADHTQNGQITLIADSDGAYITVTVTDTGEGIEPELLPRVFERGVSGRGGTGYGLYICKAVVEAHGGTIKIESEPGKGTAVIFTVPVYGGQEAGHRL
jgi:signal transduction histidine kinase